MPPKAKRAKKSNKRQPEYEFDDSNDAYDEIVLIPDAYDSGSSDDFDSETETYENEPQSFFRETYKRYTDNQIKLEKNHTYQWVNGETTSTGNLENLLLLTDTNKKKINESSPVELFENFFCDEIKNYIIEATSENGLDLSLQDFNTFVGIIILTAINKRKSQRDHWSTDPYLRNNVIACAMSRTEFEKIKSKLKYSKSKDTDHNDKGWRVRAILEMFRRNIQRYGYFETAISGDEMMAKSYARTGLK